MNALNILLLVFISMLIIYLDNKETFDEDTSEFVPIGYNRYGLMGNLLRTHPIDDCFYDQYNCYFNTF